ncbi:MAG: HD domain-containing protein [Chitinophagaceae bacterium]|nr:HD domain-containing protein [Chitinophagaceae bacterium]
MNYSKIERDVEEFVRNTYISSDRQYPYHNLDHTIDVVQRAAEIAEYFLLPATEMFIVKVAAWFHDIGHLTGDVSGHEQRGVEVMEGCLGPLRVSDTLITSMAGAIMATKYPSFPRALYEEILCDADTFHFGTPRFKETDELVRKEVELRTGQVFKDWHARSIRLLEEHRFFTKYCQQLLAAGKQENIRWLRSLS